MTIGLDHARFAYGRAVVLDDLTVTATPGRVTAVLGPNAVGKSTLLRGVAGALRPAAGRVQVDGHDAFRLSGRALASRIAYVAQRPSVSAAFSVREVVELGRYALPADEGRIDAALAVMELTDLAGRPFAELSVGQQQRVTLARAVAQLEPGGHLVLDEPTAAMDLRHARDTFARLRDLAAGGATVLMAIHDLGAAAAVADDAWLLAAGSRGGAYDPGDAGDAARDTGDERHGGRLVAAGPVDDVLQADRLERIFGVAFEWRERGDGRRVLLADQTTSGV